MAQGSPADDKKTDAIPYFFAASTEKFVVLSFFTAGLYCLYWFYQNWLYQKWRARNGEPDKNVMPFVRALFSFVTAYTLLSNIQKKVQQYQIAPKNIYPELLAAAYLVLYVATRLPWTEWAAFFTFLPLIPANKAAIAVNRVATPNCKPNNQFTIWNWVWIAIGIAFIWGTILGMLGWHIPLPSTRVH